jgi:hypothetical protein
MIGTPEAVVPSVTCTEDGSPVESWEGRLLGSRAVTVLAPPPDQMVQLLNHLAGSVKTIEHRFAVAIVPRVRNVAAQILKIASGPDTFRTSQRTSDRFRSLGVEHQGVVQLAKSMKVTPRVLVERVDELLHRQNAHTHPGALAALDAEVAEVASTITPAMQQLACWECKIVAHYEVVKAAFPLKFQ